MKLDYLKQIGFRRGREFNAFILTTKTCLQDVKNRKIYLFGVGQNCFMAESLLREEGFVIGGYIDNSERIAGRKLNGKEIFEIESLETDTAFIIITVDEKNIAGVRLQLMAMGLYDYGIFFRADSRLFEDNIKIQESIIEGINYICFSNEDDNSALPYLGYANGYDGSQLGNVNWLITSTLWFGPALCWAEQFLGGTDKNVLDIGPGFGLFSYVLLNRSTNTSVSWLIFGDKQRREFDLTNKFEKGLYKVYEKYKDRTHPSWGILEMGDYSIKDKFDLIVLTEVFEHFATNPVHVMGRIVSMLKDKGRIILTTPNWGHLNTFKTWRDLPDINCISRERYNQLMQCGHVYQYSKEELQEIFAESGLTIEKYCISDSNNHNFLLKKNN